MELRIELHLTKPRTFDIEYAIMFGKPFVDEGKICIKEIQNAQVFSEQVSKEMDRLRLHVGAELVVELGVTPLINGDALKPIEFEPLLGELLCELPSLRILNHSPGLFCENFWIAEFALFC